VTRSAYPSPLGYSGFPKACCTSVNNVIVHGIPDEFVTDIWDFVAYLIHIQSTSRRWRHCEHRYHRVLERVSWRHLPNIFSGKCGESTASAWKQHILPIIKDEAGRDLVNATNDALEAGIAVCGPGQPFKFIGKAIHDLADQRGYSVSSQFTGHGIGEVFHRSPWILHHRESSCL
jgi:methionyl aminopeptidase